ncbi:chaplin [Streptomyces sp. NPDC021093]|uniref:chaplin n=1 Tax=Streptomyces sp. NPDC021093 TaxID=3365112 RepID=UPI0037ADE433
MKSTKIAAVIASSLMVLGGAAPAMADAGADATVTNSPGVISGNNIQVPVHVPVNVCGNSVNLIALLNPAFGNTCVNK